MTGTGVFNYSHSNITSVTPSKGQLGVVLTIEGNYLFGGGSKLVNATLAGVTATIQSAVHNKTVLVAAESSAKTGDIVLTSDSGALVQLVDGFTYQDPSTITNIDPATGQLDTLVTITGSNLLGKEAPANEKLKEATLGALTAEIVSSNQTVVVLKVKNGTAGTVDVTLKAVSGATTVALSGFSYTEIGQINSVTPSYGQLGTQVVLAGKRMLGGGAEAATVSLAGHLASINSSTATKIVVVPIDAAAGQGDVVVTSDTGAVVRLDNGFTYNTASGIDAVTPNFGQLDTIVTITGSSLRGSGQAVETVYLAGEKASITTQNDTMVIVVAVHSAAKTGDCSCACRLGCRGHQDQRLDLQDHRQHRQGRSFVWTDRNQDHDPGHIAARTRLQDRDHHAW